MDAREVDRPGGGEELSSPYITDEVLDLAAWARDAFLLGAPAQVLCSEDAPGCARCARRTSTRPAPSTHHERGPDPRWAKLGDLKLD